MTAPTTWSFTTAKPDPAPGVCPCSVWTDATTPATLTDPDSVPIELGTQFTADTAGSITGVRFYKGPSNAGTHTVSLWNTSGTRLATATVTGESIDRLADGVLRRARRADGRDDIRRLLPGPERPVLLDRRTL